MMSHKFDEIMKFSMKDTINSSIIYTFNIFLQIYRIYFSSVIISRAIRAPVISKFP